MKTMAWKTKQHAALLEWCKSEALVTKRWHPGRVCLCSEQRI